MTDKKRIPDDMKARTGKSGAGESGGGAIPTRIPARNCAAKNGVSSKVDRARTAITGPRMRKAMPPRTQGATIWQATRTMRACDLPGAGAIFP